MKIAFNKPGNAGQHIDKERVAAGRKIADWVEDALPDSMLAAQEGQGTSLHSSSDHPPHAPRAGSASNRPKDDNVNYLLLFLLSPQKIM